MNEQLKLLIELQKLDTSIIRLDRTIKTIPGKISAYEAPINEARSNLEKQKQKYEQALKKKRDRERDLDDFTGKIGQMKARSGDIKDNKAYQAHIKEIERAEQDVRKIEDEILELMEEVEVEAVQIKEAEAVLKKEQERIDGIKKELDAEANVAKKGLDELKGKRAGFTDGLEKEIYDEYITLLTTMDGLAVAIAENEICTGCNMNIMPQLFVKIKNGDEIINCPQCKRILYFQPPEETPE